MARQGFVDRFNQALMGFGTGMMEVRKQNAAEAAAKAAEEAAAAKAAEEKRLQPFKDTLLMSQAEKASMEAQSASERAANEKLKTRAKKKFIGIMRRPTQGDLAPGQAGPTLPAQIAEQRGIFTPEAKERQLKDIRGEYEAIGGTLKTPMERTREAKTAETEAEVKGLALKKDQREQEKLDILRLSALEIMKLPPEEREQAAKELVATVEPLKAMLKEAYPKEDPVVAMAKMFSEIERQKTLLEALKLKGKVVGKGIEVKTGLDKTMNAFTLLVDKKFKQLEEPGLFGLFEGGGLVSGAAKAVGAKAKIKGNEATGAYAGQLVETALQQNYLITGSVRVVQSVFEKLMESYPSVYDPDTYTIDKVAQSVRNVYGTAKAATSLGLQERAQIAPTRTEKIGGSEVQVIDDPELEKAFSNLTPEPLTREDEIAVQKYFKRVFGSERYEKYKSRLVNPQFPDAVEGGTSTSKSTIKNLSDEELDALINKLTGE